MNLKKIAAQKAIKYVKDGMKLGLGTGSTIFYFIEEVGKLVEAGYDLTCVSTSNATTLQAKELGIKILDVNQLDSLDLVVDGADEIDQQKNCVKGGGGALFREKVVAQMAKEYVIIVDKSKVVKELGGFKLPVEIVKFGFEHTIKKINNLGYKGNVRTENEEVFITDNGNYIYDLTMPMGYDPYEVYDKLKAIVGVVEVGLFLDMCDVVCVGE